MPLVRTLQALPATLLVLVAGWQAVRVETHDQSPWIGAGYAMFSYVDAASYRPLVVVDVDDPGATVPIPSGHSREIERLLAAPTDARAADFAATIAAETGATIRVEVWRPIFDGDGLVLTAEMIAAGEEGPR